MSKHVECGDCKLCFTDYGAEWFFCPNCNAPYGRGENGEAVPLLFVLYDACRDHDNPDDSHYTKGKIEPWDYIIANDLDFFEGNIVKYVTRWKYKNGIEDLKKVVVYANKLLEIAQDPNRIREKK